MQKIDQEVRHAIMELVWAVAAIHPEVQESRRKEEPTCDVCQRVRDMLALLDAEQREYGPAIDVTDPSYSKPSYVGDQS